MTSARRLFVGVYAISGGAALIYEVAWTRLLALHMGHTVAAASTVLAAFMGGLAVGAILAGYVVGQHADGSKRGSSDLKSSGDTGLVRATRNEGRYLRAYAACEVAVAIAAVLLPFALAATTPALAWAYADGTAPLRFGLVRAGLSLLLVAIPAAAMGATYPFGTAWLAAADRDGRAAAADAGALYAGNTAGAAIGAVAAGFWLLPAFGLRATTWIGVVLNVAAAGVAWKLSAVRNETAEAAENAEEQKGRKPGKTPRPPRSSRLEPRTRNPRVAYAAASISGFVALVYEVAWTRMLALVIGPTTYAFSAMAASFVAGLAVGSAAGTRIARHAASPRRWLGFALVATALFASAGAWFAATRLPLAIASEVADPSAAFGPIVLKQALIVALVLAPMTIALGAAFPLALAVACGADGAIERESARVYAANTAGAIAGALAAGFLLVPQLGLKLTFAITAAAGAAAGLVVAPTIAAAAASIATVALAGAGTMRWDVDLLASGAYKYAPYMESGDFAATLRAGRILYYKDGAAATVSVRSLAGTLSLAIDGKVDASNGGDMLTQRMLGLIPTLLHPDPREVCIIGLGSGVTVDAALARGTVTHADVVEISPEVVEASRYFDRENEGVLRANGVRLLVGDGRSHLALTPRRYDIIVSEPSNPWIAGVSALFTREFFEAARARLEPGGLLCQWAHTYDISPADLRSIVGTFASVFPNGTMWLVADGDVLLIGSKDGSLESRLPALETAWQHGRARALMADSGVPNALSFALASLYAGGPRELAGYAAEAPVQTDDLMALEYSAPRGIYGRGGVDNGLVLRQLAAASPKPPAIAAILRSGTASAWAERGAMALKADAFATAFDAYRESVTHESNDPVALAGLSDAAAGAHRQRDELEWIEELTRQQPGNAAVRIELSRLYASAGDFNRAAATAEEALALRPNDPRAAEQLASVLADAGDGERLLPLSRTMVERFPERPDPRYYLATALFLTGRPADAERAILPVVADNPRHSRAQNLLGAACATVGRRDCARTAFLAALDADPRSAATYVNLGQLAFDGGDLPAAVEYYAEALSIDPANGGARDGLARARAIR